MIIVALSLLKHSCLICLVLLQFIVVTIFIATF